MVRFSKKYGSFTAWHKAIPRTSVYAKRVIKLHRLNPVASLPQIRLGKYLITDFGSAAFEFLTATQKVEYNHALEVLRLMRNKNFSLTKASKSIEFPIKKAIKYLGKTLRKVRGRYYASRSDRMNRKMHFFEKGRKTRITVTNSTDAHLIGQYFSAVGRLSFQRDLDALKPFEGLFVIDADGQKHYFETDPDKVRLILSRIEDFEIFEVYSDA